MGIVLQISSDWTNVINAIIFEIVLITLIFFLTADVCARLNYLALVDGSVQDLVVISPPLLGGGVISTSRRRTLLMIMLRGLGVLLIFGTALTIDGETDKVPYAITKMVRSPADVSNLERDEVIKLINLRYTCIVNENDTAVFGRLDEDGYCETDTSLLNDAMSISSKLEQTTLSFSRGCRHTVSTIVEEKDYRTEYAATFCVEDDKKASVFCFRRKSRGRFSFSECMASLKRSATEFAVCEAFDSVLEGPSISINANCHPATNLHAVQDLWPKAANISDSSSIVDSIGAISVAGMRRREVQRLVLRDVTKVHQMWFLCLAVKLVLLVLLGILSIQLRCKGAKRVLNDDRALLALLKQKLDDWIGAGVSNTQEQATIFLHLQTNEEGDRNVWASSMPNYNIAVDNPEAEE